jgi:hypothetical protein
MAVASGMRSDIKKLQWTIDALKQRDPFEQDTHLLADNANALDWQAARSGQQVMAERELATAAIEAEVAAAWYAHVPCVRLASHSLATGIRSNGECADWFKHADGSVLEVANTVCGPVLARLALRIGHPDTECVDMFRTGSLAGTFGGCTCTACVCLAGAQLFGQLPLAGIGEEVVCQDVADLTDQRHDCAEHNRAVFKLLREDHNARALHELTHVDHRLGRMTKPFLVAEASSDTTDMVRAVLGDAACMHAAVHVVSGTVCPTFRSGARPQT